MRKSLLRRVTPVLFAATIMIGGAAISQVPGKGSPVAPETRDTTEKSQDALSKEDQNATPFPVGRHASTVKRICTECHNAKPILDIRFTKDEATRYYKNMVSSDVATEDARQVIEYLSTTLGR